MDDYRRLSDLLEIRLPDNPKAHDLETIKAMLREFGFIGTLQLSHDTIVGGNGRVEALVEMRDAGEEAPEGIIERHGDWWVPVSLAPWLDGDQIVPASIALNRGGEIGGWRTDVLMSHLEMIGRRRKEMLKTIGFAERDLEPLRELHAGRQERLENIRDMSAGMDYAGVERMGVDLPFDYPGEVPDARFPSDNEFDIPTLDVALQADYLDMPCLKWGVQARHKGTRMEGTYHFYTEDYKFSALWKRPERLVHSGCPTAIEPNFSINDQMPMAVVIYRVYQKRWMARYWQSMGVRMFVDLNVPTRFQEINLMGVPEGWGAFATRAYTEHKGALKLLEEQYGIAKAVAERTPLFVVYGGGKPVKEKCGKMGWTWVPEDSDKVRGRYSEV